MKDYLMKLVTRKKTEMKKLQERSESSQDIAEVRAIGAQLEALKREIEDAETQLAELDKDEADKRFGSVPEGAELRNGVVVGSATVGALPEGDLSYRQAFMEMVLRNKPIPAELRQDANTTTGDVATVIPTVLVNRIIEKLDNVGMVLPLITKTSYKAGVVIPTSTVKPVATWVGSAGNVHGESASSDKQKKTTGSITFSYYKLRCEISMSMEVSTLALSVFESKFVENVAKAMTYAIENAIINGTGLYQPTGILAETPETGQALTTGGEITFAKLVEAEGVLPVEYETGAKWCMNKKTFAKVLAMVDDNNQPIARVNFGIGGKLERTINGRDVLICPYVADDFMFMFDFADYVLNTIYDMGISKKQDWDTEDLLTKAVMSVDGKVIEKGSLVTLEITPAV